MRRSTRRSAIPASASILSHPHVRTSRNKCVIDLVATGGLFFVLDQGSKKMVEVNVGEGCRSWGRILRIRRVTSRKNFYKYRGARAALVVVWLAALISAITLHRFGAKFQSHTALLGLGAAFGGAGGNLWDILRRRGVIDFIDLGWWPVFNLADIAILGGLVLAFWPRT